MSAALPKAERLKLAKLLSLALGTEFAGEREAASVAARRLLDHHGISWADALGAEPLERELPQIGIWRQTVAELLTYPSQLRPWEKTFLTDVTKFQRLSTKQRYCLQNIAERVLGGVQ